MKKYAFLLLAFLLNAPLWAQMEDTEPADSIESDTLMVDTLAADLPWPQNVQQQLGRLASDSPLLQTSQLGLLVWDLTADSALFAHNARQTMRPASTMKLVTAISALHHLGRGYQFRTSLYRKGRLDGRTFTGDLTLVGGMDPAFDITDLRDFAYYVHHLGIDTLQGRIVADLSMKDTLKWGEGWCWDDDNYTLSPLLVGKKANVPERFVAELARSGVVVADVSLARGYLASDAQLVATCEHSLDVVLQKMMKESDNLYAEAVFYNLAASYGSRPARAIYARTLIKQLVNHLGLRGDDYRFADGSGLSLYDYVSPELMVALLRYAWQQPVIYEHLLPSLPIAGEDGTLKKRMKKTAAQGNVQAKTGTVTGISSLAGYCTAANGHRLCFCIINQGVMHGRDGRNFQDRVCVALCQ
ncbi:MAG: D-alanyl-D-alanine carboxypeptidase/D-alanyl-D-alanine-endopeptidase [Prevotella sp.]|nr:D-alanyl-D-alanine carboxypeptidase/D-alanyl-D-alanine-endopeptidase [Prevotella sp.]